MKALSRGALCGLFLAAAGCGGGKGEAWTASDEPVASPGELAAAAKESPVIDPKKELLVTDLSVVEDPLRTTWPLAGEPDDVAGAWTFGALISRMAGDHDPSDFALHWLEAWANDQTVNGRVASARPSIDEQIIKPWKAASGGEKLDMAKAPFRLLAIVNRLDLRSADGDHVEGGEGRFVFCAVSPTGAPLQFTVIFEYGNPADDAHGVKHVASRWHSLGQLPFGELFNERLGEITWSFSRKHCSNGKPNGSCLNQIRTNEVRLAPAGSDPNNPFGHKLWELREFHLSPDTGYLEQSPLAQTPDASFNGTAELADLVNQNAEAAKGRQLVVPGEMLAASNPAPAGGFWGAPGIVDNEARFGLSMNTCNGCHTTETATNFVHVKPRAAGAESVLSGFLTGTTAADPVTGEGRSFSELSSRASDMAFVLTSRASDVFDDDSDEGHGRRHHGKHKSPH